MMPKKQEGNTYRGVDLDAIKNTDLKAPNQSDWFSVGDDKLNTPVPIRLLPPVGQMGGVPWVRHVCHFSFGGKGFEVEDASRGITCLNEHGAEECPVCEVQEWAAKAGVAKVADVLVPRVSYYANIIDRTDGKLKRWNVKASIMKKLVMWFDQAGDYTDTEKGRDILVCKTGKAGQWKTYRYHDTALAFKETPINLDGWEDQVADLTTMIRVLPADQIREILKANLKDQIPFAELGW